jgi:NADH-quinone oxidoreductase subunit N
MGKVLVFRPALESGNSLVVALVVVAVIGSAISAYYYLRLIVVMFFKERVNEWAAPRISGAMAAALIVTVLGVLYFGIFSDAVIQRFSHSPVYMERAEK